MSKKFIIESFEKSQKKANVPKIETGDTVLVRQNFSEGKKKRIQSFEGSVIKVTGKYSRTSFTIRRVLSGVGTEITFLVHSPLIEVEVLAKHKVRRARLYYLRDRIGSKSLRLKPRSTFYNKSGTKKKKSG